MGSVLYLLLFSGYITQLVSAETFLVTAPSIFHVGTKETVSVQVGEELLKKPVTCYLEQEVGRVLMSNKETTLVKEKGRTETLQLEISPEKLRDVKLPSDSDLPYLNLVCEVDSKRRITRVLVSQHRGYIFIQTNQPMYNPTQKVQYRIFTLNHAMRPVSEFMYVYLINAEGNIIKSDLAKSTDGIYTKVFDIPDVSLPGVWKIKAHYKGDTKSATIREFKVQKFVLPSFGVTIKPETDHLLVSAVTFKFSIDVSYSYGKTITGGFHCRFGIRAGNTNEPGDIKFLKGLEKSGAVKDGQAEIVLNISDIQNKLAPLTLEEVAQDGVRFYIAVSVTDTLSGELQDSEIFLPIVAHRYKVDMERTRSHFIPNMPFKTTVVVRTPNGVPAKGIPVTIKVSDTNEKHITVQTDDEGVAHSVFNVKQSPQSISVEATVDGLKSVKEVPIATSSSNNFLQISIGSKVLAPGEQLNVKFDIVNGKAKDDHVYYLILSKGAIKESNSVVIGVTATVSIPLKYNLIPSFRLIGYYYNMQGEIIADSIWVDVKDVCERKVEISEKSRGSKQYRSPSESIELNIDVDGQQKAKVALLAVDKAIYALNADNKLTPKQVFSSMQSYDLGCSYGGGGNTAAVFNDAGLSFISHSETHRSQMRKGINCESGFRRQKRAIDLQKELAKKETEFSDKELQKCCRHGLTLLPMKLSCEERKKRMKSSNECVQAFMKCCDFATQLRKKKRQEEIMSSHGRSVDANEIENFFDSDIQYIRRSFPPSFAFEVLKVNSKATTKIILPDSITTWEIQAVSLSPDYGFCVAKPLEIQAFKDLFVSLQLPYSVKKNEQMAIVVVIYNYGNTDRELAVHMKQVEGLCSPGATTTDSYLNVDLARGSSETVTFSAVPLMEGEIPITIQLYDKEFDSGVDAIQKTLLVMNEGIREEKVESQLINLDGRSDKFLDIDGALPDDTVPGSRGNIFVKIEDEAFGVASVTPLLNPGNVKKLIKSPHGCAEQTMIRMSPTALAIRYMDSNNGWLNLEPEMRDKALKNIEEAYNRILTFKKPDGSYGAWVTYPTSRWLTALVVKVLSLVADCELAVEEGQIVSQLEIRKPVEYLIKNQEDDGSFVDPNPVIHREMQGGIGGVDQDASLTAFVAIALKRSLPFLDQETDAVNKSISKATGYLLNRVDEIQRPFSLAITTYCLSLCLEGNPLVSSAWAKLKSIAVKEGNCKVWRDDEDLRLQDEKKKSLVPSAVALTVETTAYALLAAVQQKDFEEAKMAVCFLASQENYEGGFKSTQDTIIALEALSEYAKSLHLEEPVDLKVQFISLRRNTKENLVLNKKGNKVETDLQRLLGSDIQAKFSGKGQAKVKVVKAFYVPGTASKCSQLAITVKVTGKVEYEAQITENYDYDYNYNDETGRKEEEDFPRSAIEWFDARTRRRRDTGSDQKSEKIIYEVCVSLSMERNLTGMAIADITLLSGFVPDNSDLDNLKEAETPFISHYEFANGRLLLYFNEILSGKECISFEATQKVPIGLLQPAPATFYDYYEQERRCTVFYGAPKRSKMVSTLCMGEVCQCAERACFKEQVSSSITKEDRFKHVCFQPLADYGFMVNVTSEEDKKSFILYQATVTEILKFKGDVNLAVDDTRSFAKRKHCKSQLEPGEYLIMGRDGLTTDINGKMVYFLDSNTWVEPKPTKNKCKATKMGQYCRGFTNFRQEYLVNGCSQ